MKLQGLGSSSPFSEEVTTSWFGFISWITPSLLSPLPVNNQQGQLLSLFTGMEGRMRAKFRNQQWKHFLSLIKDNRDKPMLRGAGSIYAPASQCMASSSRLMTLLSVTSPLGPYTGPAHGQLAPFTGLWSMALLLSWLALGLWSTHIGKQSNLSTEPLQDGGSTESCSWGAFAKAEGCVGLQEWLAGAAPCASVCGWRLPAGMLASLS